MRFINPRISKTVSTDGDIRKSVSVNANSVKSSGSEKLSRNRSILFGFAISHGIPEERLPHNLDIRQSCLYQTEHTGTACSVLRIVGKQEILPINNEWPRYLENRFVEIARNCKRYSVLTKNTYRNTVIKESQKAVMEEFVDNVKILINALGYKVLEPLLQTNREISGAEDEKLFIAAGGASATGIVTAEGFVVFKGSTVNQKPSSKSLSPGLKKLRDKLFAEGKVDNPITTENILFSSSSAAADFVLGYSVSGPRTWKRTDGLTLREIEEKEQNHFR